MPRGTAAASAYYADIADLSGGANARQARTVFEALRKLCARDLRTKSIFKLEGIANYTLRKVKARGAREISRAGQRYSVRATPTGQKRVYCHVLKTSANDVLHPPMARAAADAAPKQRRVVARWRSNGLAVLAAPRPSYVRREPSCYKDVAESIGCKGITEDIVKKVCEGVRKAIVRDVKKTGQFKIYGLSIIKLKKHPGRPARAKRFYNWHTKTVAQKNTPALPPYKAVSGRVLAPLQNLFRPEPYVHGHAAVKSFFDSWERATGTPTAALRRIFDGLHKVAVRRLNDTGNFAMPALGVFRLIVKQSTTEAPMVIRGKSFTRREKPAVSRVICKAASALSSEVVG